MKKTLVVFVGAGRSGSTLIDLLLERNKFCFAVGELRYFFSRSIGKNQLCSCGDTVFDCLFWSELAKKTARLELTSDYGYFNFFERLRNFYRLLLSRYFGCYRKESQEYTAVNMMLLDYIFSKAGKSVIVDSSKFPFRALAAKILLARNVDVRLVHLVRDPRAVAYSWTTVKKRPEIKDEEVYMDRHSFVYSSLLWALIDVSCKFVKLFYSRDQKITIRYEDFCVDPVGSYSGLSEFMTGVPDMSLDLDEQHNSPSHALSGNPIRFNKILKVSRDDRWLKNTSKFKRVIFGVLLYPLLKSHGYKL
ncbi:sulfotransferase [Reinekea marinisedimentorum]|uniref:Sulfotransferase family protein n=1 Tax=Reinekea marinisedimentorum TaxID=230495 RepID=A0A4R3I701_9GAMM|nr:sulfotransferase [Reinekea marinisedimentorum]TCS41925.1 sulfotransferase family protein [Reinekea marinisedimentorum]